MLFAGHGGNLQMATTRIVKRIELIEFKDLIDKYENFIEVNPHANFRLDDAQRKVYKDEYLVEILTKEHPVLIGIQENGRYAAFFRRKEGYLRIIFAVDPIQIEIGTFYITETIPKI